MAIQPKIVRQDKPLGEVRRATVAFILKSDRLTVSIAGQSDVDFDLDDLKGEAELVLGVKKAAKMPASQAKAVADSEARELKLKINKAFNKKMRTDQLTRNWRNRPMTMLGIAIILAEAKGDKETNGTSGTRNVMNKFNESAKSAGTAGIVACGKNGQSPIYSLADVDRLKTFYLENWKNLRENLSKTARQRMASKKAQPAA